MSELNHHDEEEYHFDDSESFDFGEHDTVEEEFVSDEAVVEEPEATKQWDNQRPKLAQTLQKPGMKKKIGMGVGFAILFIVGFYIMTPHGNRASVPSILTEKMNDASQAATTVATTKIPASQTPPTAMTNVAANADANNADNTRLDNEADDAWLGNSDNSDATTTASTATQSTTTTTDQAQGNDSMSMQIQTLNEENQTLTLQLQQTTAQSEATEARANALEKEVSQLQSQIEQMNRTLQNMATAAKPQPTVVHSTAAIPSTSQPESTATENKTPVTYYVEAIIPGRAWIEDSNGHIVTVAVGDRFEALNSTVKTIDPINGMVILNNGTQIEYGMVAQ